MTVHGSILNMANIAINGCKVLDWLVTAGMAANKKRAGMAGNC